MAVSLAGSVGRGGENRAPDVRSIQKLLNQIYPLTPLVIDGRIGPRTIARIERFQRRFMQSPDGRVDPSGRTLRSLLAAAPAADPVWSGDSSAWSQEKKLESLDRRIRPKVERVLEALKSGGFKPKVVFAWRSVAVQAELLRLGRTRVSFSFHNAQTKSGTPNAYAADVIDSRWAWSAQAEQNGFWEALGRAAKDEGLYWGGSWITFKDWAHLQLYPSSRLADIKRESGLA